MRFAAESMACALQPHVLQTKDVLEPGEQLGLGGSDGLKVHG